MKTFPPRYSSSARSLHADAIPGSVRHRGRRGWAWTVTREPVAGYGASGAAGATHRGIQMRAGGTSRRDNRCGTWRGDQLAPRSAEGASVTVIAPKISTRAHRISDLLALRTTLGAEARQGRVDPSGFRRIKCFRSSARFLKHPICLLRPILAAQGHFMISRAVPKPCCRSVT